MPNFDKISDSDLRRAFLLYLSGSAVLLLISVLALGDIVGGLTAEGTSAPPESTPRVIYDVLLVVTVPLMVSSQLWYLRTKHIRGDCDSRAEFYRRTTPEAAIVLWVIITLAVFISLPESLDNSNILFNAVLYITLLSLIILFGVLIIYYPVIIIWKFR